MEGYDVMVTGSLASSSTSYRDLLKPGFALGTTPSSFGAQAPLQVTPILMNQLRIQGVLVGHRDDFEAMLRAISQHGLRPVVDSVWPWTAARDALEHQRGGRHFGKIALVM